MTIHWWRGIGANMAVPGNVFFNVSFSFPRNINRKCFSQIQDKFRFTGVSRIKLVRGNLLSVLWNYYDLLVWAAHYLMISIIAASNTIELSFFSKTNNGYVYFKKYIHVFIFCSTVAGDAFKGFFPRRTLLST